MPMETYSGAERKLLLAFDVGITYSAISYSILEPGEIPNISAVTRFLGQAVVGGDGKIPSVMYYSQDGRVCAVGTEADKDDIDIIAEEEGWVRGEWFTLHLRPEANELNIPPLPLGKTVVEVLSDFLKYLNDCAKQYIDETRPCSVGAGFLDMQEIHYILSHPSGYEAPQQALMRQAAEKAGLITSRGQNKITFITEGEASLYACMSDLSEIMSGSIQRGEGVTIADAGGGTINLSTFARRPNGGGFEEIAESQCYFRGSVFVTKAAAEYMDGLLQGSKFHGDIPEMTQAFGKSTMWSFCDSTHPQYVRFGSVRDKDPRVNIRAGKLRLDGDTVASFFQPSVRCIIDGVQRERHIYHKCIHNVVLVGSFSASDYLFRQIKEGLEPFGLHVFRPDIPAHRLVPDGAISSILKFLL